MNNQNLLLMTDVYKLGHMLFYPEGTTEIYSYLCARSDKKSKDALFFGLQYYLAILEKGVTHADVDEFLEYRKNILGGNPDEVVQKMRALADLGYIPIKIKAVPEGTVIDNKNVLATVVNTHPDFPWVVGFFESLLLKVWNTVSVATESLKFKRLVTKMTKETSDSDFLLPFLVHDFGYRGCSSEETAALSGASHLVNFLGTDTVPAIKLAKEVYNASEPIGLSVPASEHSVMCCFGTDGELNAFKRMLELNPTGLVSIVSDTYDFFNVMTNFTDILCEDILSRDGKVVFRPDSGDPKKILCGDPEAPVGSPEYKGAIRILDEKFGSTINSKGFKELNPKVGLIYGDGMYYGRFKDVLETMRDMGYANTNLVIGIGGLLLQQHNRDDLGFAFKATFAVVSGEERQLFKDPKTDTGKRSHKGRMKLVKENGKFVTIDQVSKEEENEGLLVEVFNNGNIVREYTFDEIKELTIDCENSETVKSTVDKSRIYDLAIDSKMV